jgi:hypothetical protein
MKKRRKSPKKIIETIKKKIFSNKFMKDNKVSDKDFTRKRKLPFTSLILFMINIVKQTIQKELTHFIKMIDNSKSNVSKSAFSQSRIKLKPEAFVELNDCLTEEFYTDNIIKEWNGFRLIGIDGSKLILPTHSEELMKKYGTLSNGMIIPQAQISSCYDLLNEIIIDSQIETLQINEMNQATRHLAKLSKGDLVITDRGYSATWFYYIQHESGVDFVNRVPKNFRKDMELFRLSDEDETMIEIDIPPQKSRYGLARHGLTRSSVQPFKLRLVKVILDTGEIEVLATTLLDKEKYPLKMFKELYFMRWGIEVNFDHLKSNIHVEEFTGLSEIAIKQDFYVSMFINNLQSIIALDSQDEMDKKMKGKKKILSKPYKYNYKINRNLSLGYMKDKIIDILTSNSPRYYEELKELFKTNPVPIRKGRKNERKHQDKNRRKYYMNRKRAV